MKRLIALSLFLAASSVAVLQPLMAQVVVLPIIGVIIAGTMFAPWLLFARNVAPGSRTAAAEWSNRTVR